VEVPGHERSVMPLVYTKLAPTASQVEVVGHATAATSAIFFGNFSPPDHFSAANGYRSSVSGVALANGLAERG
jgi:hypothetical protein